MDSTGLFCTAVSGKTSGSVKALCKLPITIDLAETKIYELGLIYTSFVPSWLSLNELFLSSTKLIDHTVVTEPTVDGEVEDDESFVLAESDNVIGAKESGTENKIFFEQIHNFNSIDSLETIRLQTEEKFGTINPRVKLLNQQNKWSLKIQKLSTVELSPSLAHMFSLPQTLTNTDVTRQKSYDVVFSPPSILMSERMYYIGCSQIKQNFVNSLGERSRIIDFVNIPDAPSNKVAQHFPTIVRYSALEGGLLSSLEFTLFNHLGEPVHSDSVEFFILFHIRERKD
jgi:hypothetical protein